MKKLSIVLPVAFLLCVFFTESKAGWGQARSVQSYKGVSSDLQNYQVPSGNVSWEVAVAALSQDQEVVTAEAWACDIPGAYVIKETQNSYAEDYLSGTYSYSGGTMQLFTWVCVRCNSGGYGDAIVWITW